MDLALAGAGAASVVHALAASAVGAPIVAVASRSAERSAERASQVGARSVGLGDLPAGADAVIVCTPPDHHAALALDLLDTGCAVLVERPLASTLADADRLVDRGGRLLYGENLAFSPVVATARRLVGDIGAIGYAEIRLLSPRPTWGSYLDPARGGGVLFDSGCSAIALALLLVGEAPVSVTASASASPGLDVDDHAEVLLGFAAGTTARIEVDWRATSTMWDVQVSSATDVVRAELAPIPGIEHNGDPVAFPGATTTAEPLVERMGHVEQLRELERVMAGDPTSLDARFGRDVLEIVYAAYDSARTGTTTSLPFTARRDATPIDHWRDAP